MFDLLLGLRRDIEGSAQVEVEIKGSQPLFRDYVMGMWMSAHGFTHF
jgi:hypothetical protein